MNLFQNIYAKTYKNVHFSNSFYSGSKKSFPIYYFENKSERSSNRVALSKYSLWLLCVDFPPAVLLIFVQSIYGQSSDTM